MRRKPLCSKNKDVAGSRIAMRKKIPAYAAAGVDIDAKTSALRAAAKQIGVTNAFIRGGAPRGAAGIGGFGGMCAAPGKGNILVASTDGVGTKLKVAALAGRHDTVGEDIVNHCVNDILVHGAQPLFFLDYFGSAHFDSGIFRAVVAGLCKACRQNGCALIGGETAEMPGVYRRGEYDLVGTIVGVVRKERVITGKSIRPGDIVIGLPSSGLHTNGYSLARKIVFDSEKLSVADIFPGTRKSVGAVLLAVHKSYLQPVRELLRQVNVRGMAHVTGGGFPDNIPRILPPAVDAVIDRSAWTPPVVFRYLHERGKVDRDEMYRVFNMGIGFTVVVRGLDKGHALNALKAAGAGAVVIGRIEKGSGGVRMEN